MVLVLAAVAGWLRLRPVGFLLLVCVVGAVVGYRQGRAERRAGRRRDTTSLPRHLPARRPPSGTASASTRVAPPRRGGPRPRYVPNDLDDEWDLDDDWDLDDWDFDDDEPYRRPRRDRHHRTESWETGDADYI